MISGHGTVETAVKATRLGAFDFIEKPLDMDKILLAVRNALEMGRLAEENLLLRAKAEPPSSPARAGPWSKCARPSPKWPPPTAGYSSAGRTGTGKELVAHAIHRQSQRSQAPFVDVNCAAIPEELIESELFGHEKGAFTGAVSAKRGKFDLAHRGTLFLDEIADMSLKTQAKILRILQEQRFERVGGTRTISVDARVLAASNKDLPAEIAAGRFREDLYYRLNVIPIRVPPLRERREDIPLLVAEFLAELALKLHQPEKALEPAALELLAGQSWPGNVRELKNLTERLVILTPTERIGPEEVAAALHGPQPAGQQAFSFMEQADFKQARADFEKQYLEAKLEEHQGNVSKTAEAIGLERSICTRSSGLWASPASATARAVSPQALHFLPRLTLNLDREHPMTFQLCHRSPVNARRPRLRSAIPFLALFLCVLVWAAPPALASDQGLYAQDPMVRISSLPIKKDLDKVLAEISKQVSTATGVEQKYITYYWQTIDAINCMGQKTKDRPIFVDLYVPGFFSDQDIADMMTAIADALSETVGIDKKWVFIHTLFPGQGQVYISGQVAVWDNYQGKNPK